ncbi:G protein-coupled receptor rhodopsin family and GPCR rhodopsin 7TM domain-containing protein [Trichostrongylus colubriformis]|uniref:G protein-coupled receptor rhodopsin family and GPCR rhodopsin 7TM domain-containing protein n=1 Tax=Trichostrongylus colubriformis TaxID=6319 RepID=A0AAN8FB09_TRICO
MQGSRQSEMSFYHHVCALINSNSTPDWYLELHHTFHDEPMWNLNRITYAYIAPTIIVFGIIGDILTVITLTHPLLRGSSIIYTYLTLLAMTDLFTQFSVVPMIMWLLEIRACSSSASFFYAHIGFPLCNALMGSSVWIVVFLTFTQYIAVCRPFDYVLRSRRVCFILFAIAYVLNFLIYAPWAAKKEVHNLKQLAGETDFPTDICPFIVCDTRRAQWFTLYEAVREFISRVFPFFLVAYMNARILITYRNTKKDRMLRISITQKRSLSAKSEKEEKRLFALLFAIIIVFFMCTIPAAPLTILVADSKSDNFPFQIFRAIVNLLEFTKFALNFYFYCLINPDIRRICIHVITCKRVPLPPRFKGQPTTPAVSLYTRSSRNTTTQVRNGCSRSIDGTESVTHIEPCTTDLAMEPSIQKNTVIRDSESQIHTRGERV